MAQPSDPQAVMAFINSIITRAPFMEERQKAEVIFGAATAHAPCEPAQPTFVPDSHTLWAPFVRDMLSLTAATSFEGVSDTVNYWREQFYNDHNFPNRNAKAKKRARSSPTPDDVPSKASRLDHDSTAHAAAQNVPPLRPYEYVSYQSVSETVARFLDDFQAQLVAPGGLLAAGSEQCFPETELWQPASQWEPRNALAAAFAAHVSKLKMPRVPLRSADQPDKPDLLLYGLGSFGEIDKDFGTRLRSFQAAASRCMINNTSGAGKTKLLIEHLCLHWGFLFMCQHDPDMNPYGSQDVSVAFGMLNDPQRVGSDNGASFVPLVLAAQSGTPSQEQFDTWRRIWESNSRIAEHLFSFVLLARLLIYERFRHTVKQIRFSHSRARTAWCALQVCPHLSGLGDIFLQLFNALSLVAKNDVVDQIEAIVARLREASMTPQLLAFDEAQAASHLHTTCFGPHFGTNTDRDLHPETFSFSQALRPVLKPLVHAMCQRLPSAKIVVSGTKMSTVVIKEALTSSIAKHTGLREVHQLGGRNTAQSIADGLAHYFSRQFADAIQSMDIWNEVVYWLQGRHRFLAVYVQAIMMAASVDKTDLKDLLNAIVLQLSEQNDDDARKFDFLHYEGLLGRTLRKQALLPAIFTDPQRYQQDVVRKAMDCIFQFLLTSQYPDYPSEDLILVEMGVARFDKPAVGREKKGIRVVVNEHIALLALMRWLDRKDENGNSPLQLHLLSAMSNPEASQKGYNYEDLIIYLLWNWFSDDGARISDVFNFESPEPGWAEEHVHLTTVSDAGAVPSVITKDNTIGLAFKADTSKESIRALAPNYGLSPDVQPYQIQRPFLKPDNRFGPDVIFTLLFDNGTKILVCIQCKCWSKGTKLHKSSDIEDILWKLSPEGWYGGNSIKAQEVVDGLKDLKDRFPRGNLQFPEPDDGEPTLAHIKYDPFPVETAVLRVFAAFKGTYELPGTTTKQVGCYPVATLSEEFVQEGCLRFSSFRKVADIAHAAATKREAAAAKKAAAKKGPKQPKPASGKAAANTRQQPSSP